MVIRDNNDEPMVEVRKLIKTYGRGRTSYNALDGVDLTVRKGEFVAVMGPSGSGKSTLLNVIGALDRPTSGEVFVDGTEVTAMAEWLLFKVRRYKVGFVFQSFHLVPTLTALENALLPVLPVGITADRKIRAADLFELVGLPHRMSHRPAELSSGEQQRVAIVRALMLDPGLVLADEPTGNLDSRTGADVFKLMRRLNEELGKTFIIVTHDARLARRCERIVYLKDGKLSATPSVDLATDF